MTPECATVTALSLGDIRYESVPTFTALHNPVKKLRCRGLLLYVWFVGRLGKGGRLSHLGDRLLTLWKTIMRFPRILNAPQVP